MEKTKVFVCRLLMYTYIFPHVLSDYTSGCALARAKTQEEAIQQLLAEFQRVKRDEEVEIKEWDEIHTLRNEANPMHEGRIKELEEKAEIRERGKKDKLQSRMGTSCDDACEFERSLRRQCFTMNDAVPFAFFVGGGS